jgi:hypothetical protein
VDAVATLALFDWVDCTCMLKAYNNNSGSDTRSISSYEDWKHGKMSLLPNTETKQQQ